MISEIDQVTDIGTFIGRFHPVIVHLPIGIITLAILLQILSKLKRFHQVIPILSLIWGLGFLSASASVGLGLLLSSEAVYEPQLLAWHKWSGIILTFFSLWLYILTTSKYARYTTKLNRIWYPMSIIGIGILLLMTGHNGGSLTHGSAYLVEYAPKIIQRLMTESPNTSEQKRIKSIDSVEVFEDAILPILRGKCISCHRKNKSKGHLILTSYREIMQGGKNGSVITPGSSAASELYRRITLPYGHKEFMPSEGKKPLTDDQVAILEWWIDKQALQKAMIVDLQPDTAMLKLFERFFGMRDAHQAMPLIAPPDYAAIEYLVRQGYWIRKLTQGNNWLEIKHNDNKINPGDVTYLSRIEKQVAWLELSNNGLSDKDVEFLRGFSNLRKLNLSKNAISDQASQQLVGLTQLEYLNLYNTQVSDSSLALFSKMPGLKELYVWQTEMRDSTIEKLKIRNTSLKIIYKVL